MAVWLKKKSFDCDVEACYDRVAERYDRAFRSLRSRPREYGFILKALPERAGRVLDLGCGNGVLLRTISPRIGSGVGVDISEEMVRLARRRTECLDNIMVMRNSGQGLPFPDNTFDCVLASFSLRYFQTDEILAECHRVLKSGGRLIAVDQFTWGGEGPPLWPLLVGKFRFLSSCLLHPMNWYRRVRLVSLSEWKAATAPYPGATFDDFLNAAAPYFRMVNTRQLNCAVSRVTYGVYGMSRA